MLIIVIGVSSLSLEECDIIAEFLRELILAGKFRHIGLPAWQFLIDWLDALLDVVWEIVDFNAVLLVSHTGLDGIEAVEHIALHHDEPG